jgi:hypothetical protein
MEWLVWSTPHDPKYRGAAWVATILLLFIQRVPPDVKARG